MMGVGHGGATAVLGSPQVEQVASSGMEHGEVGRLVLSGAVGAASRREVWGDGEM